MAFTNEEVMRMTEIALQKHCVFTTVEHTGVDGVILASGIPTPSGLLMAFSAAIPPTPITGTAALV